VIETFMSWSLLARIGFGLGSLVLFLGILAAVGWVMRRRRGHHRYPDQPTIPIFFDPKANAGPGGDTPTTGEWKPPSSLPREHDPTEMIGRRHGAPKEETRSRLETATSVAEAESEPEKTHAPEPPAGAPSSGPSARQGSDTEEEDQTLQLLPGRMEVVAGGLRGREIRFVRMAGDTYTFGRQPGQNASHIQIQSATVSRMHAAMRYVNGRWRIRNLSSTNPVRINGEVADTPHKEYTLHDGDRIEMGEVAFLFREQ
jgi:hypothetical protein